MQQHRLTERQFGARAQQYLTSAVHAGGADLGRLTEWVANSTAATILDLGCGAGHASYALARGRSAARVIACDPAAGMLQVVAAEAQARRHLGIEIRTACAEQLPFAAAEFDLVVTRYSAHHWLDAGSGIGEAARVLRPGGTLIVIDVLAPESPLLDTALQTMEILRDPSHVRNYRASEWCRMLQGAGLTRPSVSRWKLPLEFDAWVARIGTSAPRIQALHLALDEFPAEVHEYFALTPQRSFAIDAGWFEAAKPRA